MTVERASFACRQQGCAGSFSGGCVGERQTCWLHGSLSVGWRVGRQAAVAAAAAATAHFDFIEQTTKMQIKTKHSDENAENKIKQNKLNEEYRISTLCALVCVRVEWPQRYICVCACVVFLLCACLLYIPKLIYIPNMYSIKRMHTHILIDAFVRLKFSTYKCVRVRW